MHTSAPSSSSRLHSQAGASTSATIGGASLGRRFSSLLLRPSSSSSTRRRSTERVAMRAAAATDPAAASSTDGGPNTSGVTAAQFVRPHLRVMAPYTPIEPFEVLSARYGRTPDQIVKLDANENPYGPPPEVAKALGSMPFAHVYPDPSSRALRAQLARLNRVDERHLLVSWFCFSPLLLVFVRWGQRRT